MPFPNIASSAYANADHVQARLDKEDLRNEMSVAALHKQTKKAVRQAADLEVTLGEHAAYEGHLCHLARPPTANYHILPLLTERLAIYVSMWLT